MRYTIMGYNQQRAVELGLDVEDLLLLDWIKGLVMTHKQKTIVKDGRAYMWVCYDTLLEDLPILGMTKGNLRRRLRKMEQAGVLTHHTDRTGGVFSYYGFGLNAEGLAQTLAAKMPYDTAKKSEALAAKMPEQRTTYNNKTRETIAEMMAKCNS